MCLYAILRAIFVFLLCIRSIALRKHAYCSNYIISPIWLRPLQKEFRFCEMN